MDYEAKVILDSVAPCGVRLTTMQLTYPRFIHSEVLTHRDRERNSASSRAIPFEVMERRISENPVMPLEWQQEGGGMQGRSEIPEPLRPLARAIWLRALEDAKRHASALRNIGATAREIWKYMGTDAYDEQASCMAEEYDLDGVSNYVTENNMAFDAMARWVDETPDETIKSLRVHKTIPNRLVEPWMWITVVMTSTEWKNFFRLRCHRDAEVHFQKIAWMCHNARAASTPREVPKDGWHLPYVTGVDEEELWSQLSDESRADRTAQEALCCISTARVARVSYLTQEGKRDWQEDFKLFENLKMGSEFGHWSPTGHVARALDFEHTHEQDPQKIALPRSGPFRGWHQFRKDFSNENIEG